jgi:hypothetical protein
MCIYILYVDVHWKQYYMSIYYMLEFINYELLIWCLDILPYTLIFLRAYYCGTAKVTGIPIFFATFRIQCSLCHNDITEIRHSSS